MKKKTNLEEQTKQNEEKEINENNEIKEKKKSKFASLIITILILIIIVMGAYILNENGVSLINDKAENKNSNSNTISDKNNSLDKESTTTDEESLEITTENSNSNSDTNANSNNNVTENENNGIYIIGNNTINANKSLNTSGITYTNLTTRQADYGIYMKTNSEKNNITLTIDWDKFGPIASPIVGGFTWATGSVEKLTINGLSNKVKSTFIGNIGQDSTGLTLFYLMENGSVEYTKLFIKKSDSEGNTYYSINYHYNYSSEGKAETNGFISEGQLRGVNEITGLYNAQASGGMSGWGTVIAAKEDGSIYDLGNIIMGY